MISVNLTSKAINHTEKLPRISKEKKTCFLNFDIASKYIDILG